MPNCVAYGCTNRASKKIPGITFHSFPKDEEKRKLWVIAVRRKNWIPTKYSVICSSHFPEDMIDRTSLSCVRLRENAVPTIFEAYTPHLQKIYKSRKSRTSEKCIKILPSQPSVGDASASSESADVPSTAACTQTMSLTATNDHCHDAVEQGSPNSSPDKVYYKRKVEELCNVIENQNKKVKVLQQKIRRYKKKIDSLSALFEDLSDKKLTNEDALIISRSLSADNEES